MLSLSYVVVYVNNIIIYPLLLYLLSQWYHRSLSPHFILSPLLFLSPHFILSLSPPGWLLHSIFPKRRIRQRKSNRPSRHRRRHDVCVPPQRQPTLTHRAILPGAYLNYPPPPPLSIICLDYNYSPPQNNSFSPYFPITLLLHPVVPYLPTTLLL